MIEQKFDIKKYKATPGLCGIAITNAPLELRRSVLLYSVIKASFQA